VQVSSGIQTTTASGSTIQGVYIRLPIITSLTIYYTTATTTGSATYVISVNDYDI
jgi:hypothetical protein